MLLSLPEIKIKNSQFLYNLLEFFFAQCSSVLVHRRTLLLFHFIRGIKQDLCKCQVVIVTLCATWLVLLWPRATGRPPISLPVPLCPLFLSPSRRVCANFSLWPLLWSQGCYGSTAVVSISLIGSFSRHMFKK